MNISTAEECVQRCHTLSHPNDNSLEKTVFVAQGTRGVHKYVFSQGYLDLDFIFSPWENVT